MARPWAAWARPTDVQTMRLPGNVAATASAWASAGRAGGAETGVLMAERAYTQPQTESSPPRPGAKSLRPSGCFVDGRRRATRTPGRTRLTALAVVATLGWGAATSGLRAAPHPGHHLAGQLFQFTAVEFAVAVGVE